MGTKTDTIREGFESWLQKWAFTGFLSLTTPAHYGCHRDAGEFMERRLNKLGECFLKKTGTSICGIGISSVSHVGRCHAHVMIMKECGGHFIDSEMRLLKRRYQDNLDARPIYDQSTLSGYIAADKHIADCREYSVVTFGEPLLKRLVLTPGIATTIQNNPRSGFHPGRAGSLAIATHTSIPTAARRKITK